VKVEAQPYISLSTRCWSVSLFTSIHPSARLARRLPVYFVGTASPFTTHPRAHHTHLHAHKQIQRRFKLGLFSRSNTHCSFPSLVHRPHIETRKQFELTLIALPSPRRSLAPPLACPCQRPTGISTIRGTISSRLCMPVSHLSRKTPSIPSAKAPVSPVTFTALLHTPRKTTVRRNTVLNKIALRSWEVPQRSYRSHHT
jgi:hypothetical protein